MNRKYFTQPEAAALVGRRIRTLVSWAGVPKNMTGTVVRADGGRSGWTVGIQWDLPVEPRQVCIVQMGTEIAVIVTGGKPLVDWFSRDEYERYLVEEEGDVAE